MEKTADITHLSAAVNTLYSQLDNNGASVVILLCLALLFGGFMDLLGSLDHESVFPTAQSINPDSGNNFQLPNLTKIL